MYRGLISPRNGLLLNVVISDIIRGFDERGLTSFDVSQNTCHSLTAARMYVCPYVHKLRDLWVGREGMVYSSADSLRLTHHSDKLLDVNKIRKRFKSVTMRMLLPCTHVANMQRSVENCAPLCKTFLHLSSSLSALWC